MDECVVNFNEHQPHAIINCVREGGVVHVFPLSLIRDWSSGRAPLPDPHILRVIIREWMRLLDYEQ